MKSRTERIRKTLEKEFHPLSLTIEDDSWKHAGHAGAMEHGGGHFVVRIVSERFADISRIERHRVINEALAPLFGEAIHALQIRAFSPDETAGINTIPGESA